MVGNTINFDKKYNSSSPIWGKAKLDIELKRYLSLLDGNNILDLGIGEGQNSIVLSKLGYNVTGVDVSKKSLDICSNISSNIELIQSDIRNFNIEKDKYNLIMSRCALQFLHKNDVKKIINNIKLNLRENGLVYISVFSTDNPKFHKKLDNDYFEILENNILHNKLDDTYTSFFTKDEILELFSEFETILISDEYSLDLSHGEPHYHGIIKYIAKK